MKNIWVREIVATGDPSLVEVKRIYRESIPEEERIPEQFFDRSLETRAAGNERKEHTARLLVAMEDTATVGFAYLRFFGREDFVPPVSLGYLLYMAVDEPHRGRGIGRLIYHSILGLLSTSAVCRGGSLSGLIFEVERPDIAKTAQERIIRERRIVFYERLGAKILEGINYVQPSLGADLPPVPMYLMYHPVASEFPATTLCKMFYKLVFGFEEDHPTVLLATQASG